MRALHLVERAALVYSRGWKRSVLLSFVQPVLLLTAMGLGVGSLVDRGGVGLPGGVSYLSFLMPGLLAVACMQSACLESSFPVHGRLNWHGSYLAIAGTPMRVVDIVVGELAWVGVRVGVLATAFLAVGWMFGATGGWSAVAAVPAVVLTGLAFSSCVLAYSGTLGRADNYNALFRFVVMPLSLFSGVYFPLERMPALPQYMAAAMPLYHGVQLARGATLHTLTWSSATPHVLYLATVVVLGVRVAVSTFGRKLQA